MKYLLIGLAVSLGWHFGDLFVHVLWSEIVYTRLREAKWYRQLTKREDKSGKGCNKGYSERKIGF